MRPVTLNPQDPEGSFREIENASHENDVVEIAQNITADTSFTATYSLLVGTPTLANTNLVLATLVQMMQKGGLNRTT